MRLAHVASPPTHRIMGWPARKHPIREPRFGVQSTGLQSSVNARGSSIGKQAAESGPPVQTVHHLTKLDPHRGHQPDSNIYKI